MTNEIKNDWSTDGTWSTKPKSSRGKWWLKWRNPNSRNSKKLSKWQTTSIDVCLMHLHICIPVLCSGITFVALWFSWRVLMKVPIGVQPHNVSFRTWEMDIEESLPWHDAECAIWGCQIEVRFQCNSTNVFFFIAGKMKLLMYGTHKHGEGFTRCWILSTELLLERIHIYIVFLHASPKTTNGH